MESLMKTTYFISCFARFAFFAFFGLSVFGIAGNLSAAGNSAPITLNELLETDSEENVDPAPVANKEQRRINEQKRRIEVESEEEETRKGIEDELDDAAEPFLQWADDRVNARSDIEDAESTGRESLEDQRDAFLGKAYNERAFLMRRARLKEQNTIQYGFPKANPVVAVYKGDAPQAALMCAQMAVEAKLTHDVVWQRKETIFNKIIENPEEYIEKIAPFVDRPKAIQVPAIATVDTPPVVSDADPKTIQELPKTPAPKLSKLERLKNLFKRKPKASTLEVLGAPQVVPPIEGDLAALQAPKLGMLQRFHKKCIGAAAYQNLQKQKEWRKQEQALYTWLKKEHEVVSAINPFKGNLLPSFALNCALRIALLKLEAKYIESPSLQPSDILNCAFDKEDVLTRLASVHPKLPEYAQALIFTPAEGTVQNASDVIGSVRENVSLLDLLIPERRAAIPMKVAAFVGAKVMQGSIDESAKLLLMAASPMSALQVRSLPSLSNPNFTSSLFLRQAVMMFFGIPPIVGELGYQAVNLAPRVCNGMGVLVTGLELKDTIEPYVNKLIDTNDQTFLMGEIKKGLEFIQQKVPHYSGFKKTGPTAYETQGFDFARIPRAPCILDVGMEGPEIPEARPFPFNKLPGEVTDALRLCPYKIPPLSVITALRAAKRVAWLKFAGITGCAYVMPGLFFDWLTNPGLGATISREFLGIPTKVSSIITSTPFRMTAQAARVWLEVKEIDMVYHSRWIDFVASHKTVFVRLLRNLTAARELAQTDPVKGEKAVRDAERDLKIFVAKGHTGPYGSLPFGTDKAMVRDVAKLRSPNKFNKLALTVLLGTAAWKFRMFYLGKLPWGPARPLARKVGLI